MASSEGMEGLDTGHESATASVTERAVVSSGGMKGLDTGHESVTASVIESASPSPSSDSQAGDIKNVSLDLHLLNLLLALLVGPVTSDQLPGSSHQCPIPLTLVHRSLSWLVVSHWLFIMSYRKTQGSNYLSR